MISPFQYIIVHFFLLFCTSVTDVYLSRISSALFPCNYWRHPTLTVYQRDTSVLIDGESGRDQKVSVLEKIDIIIIIIILLTITARAQMGSESIAHEAEGPMGF